MIALGVRSVDSLDKVSRMTSVKQAFDLKLGRLLQDKGLINEHQLLDALQAQAASGGRLGTILVRRGCLTDHQLDFVLRAQQHLRNAPMTLTMSLALATPPQGTDPAAQFHLALTVPESPAALAFGEGSASMVATQDLMLAVAEAAPALVAFGSEADGSFSLSGPGRPVRYEVAFRTQAAGEAPAAVPNLSMPLEFADGPRIDDMIHAMVEIHVDPEQLNGATPGLYRDLLSVTLPAA